MLIIVFVNFALKLFFIVKVIVFGAAYITVSLHSKWIMIVPLVLYFMTCFRTK
jgi:hypothetical protein